MLENTITKFSNKKCEVCSMDATHSEYDLRKIEHFFCSHHSLKKLGEKNKNISLRKLAPLFWVFFVIFILSIFRQLTIGPSFSLFMMDFMGIFFLTFGFFKLLDLNGFVDGFKTYDFIALKFPVYGYFYPFLEISLGVLYLAGQMFLFQNLVVLVISLIGIMTAYSAINHHEEIQCVCLGTIFNLPMTWVTLFENGLMFVMVIYMLFFMTVM